MKADIDFDITCKARLTVCCVELSFLSPPVCHSPRLSLSLSLSLSLYVSLSLCLSRSLPVYLTTYIVNYSLCVFHV